MMLSDHTGEEEACGLHVNSTSHWVITNLTILNQILSFLFPQGSIGQDMPVLHSSHFQLETVTSTTCSDINSNVSQSESIFRETNENTINSFLRCVVHRILIC